MAFGLTLKSTPKREIEEKVQKAAEILGLSDLLQRYPKHLSGGQRQRVAMGRAIVRDPVLYLFDEPLSNLDAKLRISMRTEIKSLHQSLKTTTVYVTHDQVEAMTMADRIVIMRDGVIEQQGSPREIYDRPANQFVAGFIGAPTMNFFEAHLASASGQQTKLSVGGGNAIDLAAGFDQSGDVLLGVRPEHLTIGASDAGLLHGRVSLVEPTGPSDYLIVSWENGQFTVVAPTGTAREGEPVSVSVAPKHLHVFDRQSGRAIAATCQQPPGIATSATEAAGRL